MVRLKVEIHEIQFLEVANYRNPRNPPHLWLIIQPHFVSCNNWSTFSLPI